MLSAMMSLRHPRPPSHKSTSRQLRSGVTEGIRPTVQGLTGKAHPCPLGTFPHFKYLLESSIEPKSNMANGGNECSIWKWADLERAGKFVERPRWKKT
ncbi:hypothetical protein RUM43_002942 [Polyplax serrata]|uniref:Uncharacterized protein n=1 Tax=Polyplax serrata TaxID=468196 RepID=A0AAN8P2S5_POLSC